jgi:hypothetical protein
VRAKDKNWNLKAIVNELCDDIGALRSYLAPQDQRLYHTDKRGKPDYNKPRQLLADVEKLINAEK